MAQEVRLEPVGRVVGGRDEVRDDAWAPVRGGRRARPGALRP